MENPNDAFIISMPEIDKRYLGGNMRLGNRFTIIKDEKSLAYQIYNQIKISERHRHRYEVNPHKIKELEEAGLSFSGKDEFGVRMEILELPRTVHPFYCGVQYHPEFTSKNFKANSLFVKYILAVCGKNINDPIPGLKKKLSS